MTKEFQFSNPFCNPKPLAIVLLGLSSGDNIYTPYFRGIRTKEAPTMSDELYR